MAVGCGAKFAKVTLIIFNIIFLCTGLVLIALGIWLLVLLAQSSGPGEIFKLASDTYLYRNAAILLIAMGSLILFVTVLGLVAAIKESKILLTIYLVFLFIIFGGEIAGGVVAIVYKDRIVTGLEDTLTKSLSGQFTGNTTYYDNATVCSSSALFGRLWDYTQYMFDCCGVSGDYNVGGFNGYQLTSPQLNSCYKTNEMWPNTMVPLTCCRRNKDSFPFDPSSQNDAIGQYYNCTLPYNEEGCVDSIENWIAKYAPVLIGIGIGFGMLEMFGVIFVVCLCMNTDKGFKRF